MRIIGAAVLGIVAFHAAHAFHHHTHLLHSRHAMAGTHALSACSAPVTAIVVGVLWPQAAIAPIAPLVRSWHATRDAMLY